MPHAVAVPSATHGPAPIRRISPYAPAIPSATNASCAAITAPSESTPGRYISSAPSATSGPPVSSGKPAGSPNAWQREVSALSPRSCVQRTLASLQ